jgi:SHS2 domain-containing protein
MNQPQAGYREIEHTADWQLEVWAPDVPLLFEQAALGMYELSGTRLESHPRLGEELHLGAPDREGLLVEFLTELLFLAESQGLAFDNFQIQIESQKLFAKISGAPIKSQSKEIKAVTYHNLEIREGPWGLEVSIVFDV